MKKKIMKVGNSLGLIFTKRECELYGITLNDVIDIEDMLIFAKQRKRKVQRSKSK